MEEAIPASKEIGARQRSARIVGGGLLGGLLGAIVMTILYELAEPLLFEPRRQSDLFLQVAPHRDITLSLVGLLGIGVFSAWLYGVLTPSIAGSTWVRRGLFWGFAVFVMFWAFQKWLTFHAVLDQPVSSIAMDLPMQLAAACVKCVVITYVMNPMVGWERGLRTRKSSRPPHCRARYWESHS